MRMMIEMMTRLARKSRKPWEKPRESQAKVFFVFFFCAVWPGAKVKKKNSKKTGIEKPKPPPPHK